LRARRAIRKDGEAQKTKKRKNPQQRRLKERRTRVYKTRASTQEQRLALNSYPREMLLAGRKGDGHK